MIKYIKTIFYRIKDFFSLHKYGELLNLEYPISWETMSNTDFRNVCTILSHNKSRAETLFLCFCALAHIRPDSPLHYDPKVLNGRIAMIFGDKTYVISPDVIRQACSQLSYILDSVGLCPTPNFGSLDRKLYGVSFSDFYVADTYMSKYAVDNDYKWLKMAVKTLTKGKIGKLYDWQKVGFPIWWNGIKSWLKDKYPFVFEDGGDVGDKTQADILADLLSVMTDNKPQFNDDILDCEAHYVLNALNKIYKKNVHK